MQRLLLHKEDLHELGRIKLPVEMSQRALHPHIIVPKRRLHHPILRGSTT
jgi:hypothetical protein